jgi:putative endonuclease
MSYFVYILRTSGNTFYIGQTNNLKKRIEQHKEKSGKSAKYLRMFLDFEVVYTEKFTSRTDAMKREAELKKLSKIKKESLMYSAINHNRL